jgi:hypothetical protein
MKNCAIDTVLPFQSLARRRGRRTVRAYGAPEGGFCGICLGLRVGRNALGSPLGAFDAFFGALPEPLSVFRA